MARLTWAQVLADAGYPEQDHEEIAAQWRQLGMAPRDFRDLDGDWAQALDAYEMAEDAAWAMEDDL